MKKCLSLVLALIMAFSALSVVSSAAAVTVVKTGSCNDTSKPGTAEWKLYSNEVLEISGNGYIGDCQKWRDASYDEEYYVEKIVVKEGIIGLSDNAFAGMYADITLPSTVKEIGENALAYNYAADFVLPAALETATGLSFAGFSTKKYELDESNPNFSVKDGVLYSKDLKTLVAFPDNAYYNENAEESEEDITYTVADFVEKIGDYAFYGAYISSIIIPDNVTEIGNYSFYLSGISSAEIGSGVKSIGDYAFNISALETVSLPEALDSIGEMAFSNTQLSGIYIPSSSVAIGKMAFGMEFYIDFMGLYEYVMNFDFSAAGIDLEEIDITDLDIEALIKLLNINPDDYMKYKPIDGFTIYGKPDSTATQYAASNGLEFAEASFEPAIMSYVTTNKDGVVEMGWYPSAEADGYKILRKQNDAGEWIQLADITDPSVSEYKDLSAQEGNKYSYSIKSYKGAEESGFSKTGSSVILVKEPTISSISNAIKGVSIKWNKCDYAKSYYVYRKSLTGWELCDVVSTTSFVDEDVSNGKLYTYCVQATTESFDFEDLSSFDFSGSFESAYGNNTAKIRFVSAPKVSKVTNNANGILVEWNKISGATGYEIYRKPYGGTYKKIATVSSGSTLSYKDTTVKNGTKYCYTVRAVRDTYKSAYNSGKSLLALKAPKVTVANTVGGALVKWDKLVGAKGYYVYRKAPSDKGWSRIATIKSGNTVSFKDTSVKSGVTYIYTVRGYDGSVKGGYSGSGTKNVFLSAPSLKSAKAVSGGIKLTYGKVSAASGYTVYRKTAKSGWTKIATVNKNSTVSYTDKTAKKGTTYYYTVRAQKGSYRSSFYSGIKCKR